MRYQRVGHGIALGNHCHRIPLNCDQTSQRNALVLSLTAYQDDLEKAGSFRSLTRLPEK